MEIHTNHTNSNNKQKIATKENALRALSGIGLLVVLFVFLMGAIFTVKYAGSGLSAAVSLFVNNKEDVEVSSDIKTVRAGESFTLTWDHKKKTNAGSYGFYYPCIEDVYLIVNTVDEGKKIALCNKQFDFVNRNNELTLIASTSINKPVEIPLSLTFTPNNEINPTISGVINVEVLPGNGQTVKTDEPKVIEKEVIKYVPVNNYPTYTYPTYPTTGNYTTNNGSIRASNPNGLADLRPIFIEVGVLDSNNNFTRTDTLRRSDYKVAVRFRVENIGDKTSAPYRFNAILPTYPAQTYNADEQPGLQPGEVRDFTMGFDRAVEGNNYVRIQIDGGDYVPESNNNNNEINIPIRVL